MDVLGSRWTVLILRDLLPGPRRYSEIRRSLAGITTNLLADRLGQMEDSGLVQRVSRDSDGRQAWALADLGMAAKPVLLALGAYGARWMDEVGSDRATGRWFVVSLERRYRGGLEPATVGLEIDGEPYSVTIDDRTLVSRDGWPEKPDLELLGSLRGIASALTPGGPLPATVKVRDANRMLRGLSRALVPPNDALET